MKKNRIILIFLVVNTLFIFFATSIGAHNEENISDEFMQFPTLTLSFVEENAASLIDISELQEIARERNVNFVPQNYKVKQLSDFNGYTYYVIEFYPMGYAIYDNRFTHILEFNANATSPYNNHTEELFYAGAGEYYIKSATTDDVYIHPISGYCFSENTDAEIFFKKQSDYVSSAVEQKAISILKNNGDAAPNATTSTSYVSLSDYSVITDVDTSDFNVNGNCGYVAGSLIVWYHYKVLGWTDFVPGGTITKALALAIQGEREPSTYGLELQEALSEWSYSHGAVEENGWQEALPAVLDTLPRAYNIYDLIDEDRPVALLGLTPPKSELNSADVGDINDTFGTNGMIEHVITITGVKKITNSLVDIDYYYFAHFGWSPAYNDVYISESSLTKGAIVYY